MMRRVGPIILLFIFAGQAAAGDGGADPAEARKMLLAGKYAESIEIYRPMAEKDPAAAIGLARCLVSEGKRAEAVKTLQAAAGRHAPVYAELAHLAFQRGDYREAQEQTDEALRLDRDHLLAGWIRAELARVLGRLDEAEAGYRRLIDYYNDHDVKQAESLRWIGLAAARYARWNRLDDQFSFLVNELYPDALKLEPGYWPAHYEAAALFLEKYNKPEAAREIQAALELNPHAAEVHVLSARLAVAGRDIEQAEASLSRALEINPNLLSAWLGRADLHWANFETRDTLNLLREKALPLNPAGEATLGRIAACYVLLDGLPKGGESTRFTRLVAKVTRQNARAGEFFFSLSAALEARHQHAEAKRFLREALRVMPQQIGPRAHLGMLAMQTGHEAEARKLLDEAFDVDPFNVRVNNMLNVLEVFDEMETLRSGQSEVRHDGKLDAVLARYASRYLEDLYPQMCQKFGYRPPGKPLVEVFNRARGIDGQQWFSTRMTGLPYLGAVAASTGHMVAMSSPNDPQSPRRYNWAQVLRHELVHVITLQQTRFNIPHWYTEGLAVYYEDVPRPQVWNELLLRRVPQGELFNLQTLNFGFTRPQSGDDWQMAYCQAKLYVDYMLWRWSPSRQRQMLAAYAGGMTTREVIPRVFGVSQEEFERGYVEYLEQTTAELSSLKWPSHREFPELLQAHRENEQDVDLAAELAYKYFLRAAGKESRELAETVLKAEPAHPLASYVLARLRLKADKEDEEAMEMLRQCVDNKSPQPNALDLLARLKLRAGEHEEAGRLYALGQRLDPSNLAWTKGLAKAYLELDNRPKLAEALARIAEADPDNLTTRQKLAQMTLEDKDYAAAADWANRALEIDVMDGEVHRMLAEALAGQDRFGEAIEEFEVAVELEPDDPDRRLALARACIRAKQPGKARRVLEKLLEATPDHAAAKEMLETIEKIEETEETDPP